MLGFERFFSKEKIIKKTIEIDNNLYEELRKLSDNKYDASINKLINASIEKLVNTENIKVYVKNKNEISPKHTLLIRESLVIALDELKDKGQIKRNEPCTIQSSFPNCLALNLKMSNFFCSLHYSSYFYLITKIYYLNYYKDIFLSYILIYLLFFSLFLFSILS